MTRGSTTAGAVDGAAAAGPWLVLGIVLGLLLAGVGAWLAVGARHPRRPPGPGAPPPPPGGWAADDLPGFLEHPPGVGAEPRAAIDAPPPAPPFAEVVPAARRASPLAPSPGAPGPGRTLVALATVAVVLVGSAAAVAVLAPDRSVAAGEPEQAPDGPSWAAPDLPPVPVRPAPGDPGAGALARLSVPVGPDGVLARLAFGGVVLERRAVGVTVAYPAVSVTAAEMPGGPALAHVRLPTWNCLTDAAPADPAAAGCLRTPVEYADLPAPALEVTVDGDRVRMTGRFPTYVRPAGSAPEWTGRVYPLAVTATAHGEDAEGTLTLGGERTATVADPTLNEVRTGD